MSFSSEIKSELAKQYPRPRHCALAELLALTEFSGSLISLNRKDYRLTFRSENSLTAIKCFTLLRKTFNISIDVMIRTGHKSIKTYYIQAISPDLAAIRNASLSSSCCKRSFIRGAFLSSGSVSDPQKSYHFEIVCQTETQANQLVELLESFGIDAKIVWRKGTYVVYLKEGSGIVDTLNIMGAHVSLMELENIRILKDMRNNVNRQVNCETANINKTVSASVKQIEDIKLIEQTVGLNKLPLGLHEIAAARIDNPDISLKELGELLNPPIGKSGVNHRLRKLADIAKDIRDQQGGKL